MSAPLCVDLFCGRFGWSRPWLELGGYVVGFDISHEPYHGPVPQGADLVLQDVRTLHGSQFRSASLILASSPCPEYSYMAMPFSRGKQIARALRGKDVFPDGYRGSRSIEELNDLFYQPQRIQREASDAAGRHIPLVQENVRGAEAWVGRAAYRYGSFYLWGDVPALMPIAERVTNLGGGASWYPPTDPRHQPGLDFTRLAGKKSSGSWFTEGNGATIVRNDPRDLPTACPNCCAGPLGDGIKAGDRNAHRASGGVLKSARFTNASETPTFGQGVGDGVKGGGSRSPARKAASAAIAEIPYPLAAHICRTYFPPSAERVA